MDSETAGIRMRFDISLATVHGIDFLLTWNFRHINNAEMKARLGTIIEAPVMNSPSFVHQKS